MISYSYCVHFVVFLNYFEIDDNKYMFVVDIYVFLYLDLGIHISNGSTYARVAYLRI